MNNQINPSHPDLEKGFLFINKFMSAAAILNIKLSDLFPFVLQGFLKIKQVLGIVVLIFFIKKPYDRKYIFAFDLIKNVFKNS
jgi:hypothetical protein